MPPQHIECSSITMTMEMETMSIRNNKSYEEQVHNTTTQYQSLYTTMSSSTQQRVDTPDHWPIASSSTAAAAHFHPIVIAKDTHRQHHTVTTRRSPLQFFSINTLLHQQDEECWENNNNNDDDSDSSSDYYEQIMKMPQFQSLSDDEHIDINIQRPSIPPTSPPPLLNTSSMKKKYVTFNSDKLISSKHYRPRTNTPDISKLYYTEFEIKQFKKEYKHDKRIEKKKLNNISNIRQIDNSICLTRLDGESEEKSLSSCQKFF